MSATVVLGVTGGIAAYKIPALVRLLVADGLDVSVVMTRAGTQFVTPLTLATLSCNPVHVDMWSERPGPQVEHISLADRADLAVIAPATANIIGKLAAGLADDLLTTVCLALKCPVVICPSMNVNMYRNRVVQRNIKTLKEMGCHVMEPESGWLACGWTGEGRMPEPEVIAAEIMRHLSAPDLEGERILVTAGPTEEPLDAVRFLTNRSSGKMGVAVAARAARRGAQVTLIAGPMSVEPPAGVRNIPVRTALEMYQRVMEVFDDSDVVIKTAAVSDFRPANPATGKIKKEEAPGKISLVRNPDILHILGTKKRAQQILVGFAAETENPLENGRKKLIAKNLDMLVLNDVTQPGAGFRQDTNVVHFLLRSGEEESLDLMTKDRVADLILDRVKEIRLRRGRKQDSAPSEADHQVRP